MDILLVDIGDGGDTRFNNGDLATDGGFSTAIYVSLFSGNSPSEIFLEEPDRTTEEVQEALDLPITLDNLRLIESKVNKSLQWFVDDGVAATVETVASNPEVNTIKIEITLTQPEGENKYTIFWDREKAGVARLITN